MRQFLGIFSDKKQNWAGLSCSCFRRDCVGLNYVVMVGSCRVELILVWLDWDGLGFLCLINLALV